jgi:hypothetical protein
MIQSTNWSKLGNPVFRVSSRKLGAEAL